MFKYTRKSMDLVDVFLFPKADCNHCHTGGKQQQVSS